MLKKDVMLNNPNKLINNLINWLFRIEKLIYNRENEEFDTTFKKTTYFSKYLL